MNSLQACNKIILFVQFPKSLCLIFLLQRSDNFIGQLWQNYWFRLIKSSELSDFVIGLPAIFSQA